MPPFIHRQCCLSSGGVASAGDRFARARVLVPLLASCFLAGVAPAQEGDKPERTEVKPASQLQREGSGKGEKTAAKAGASPGPTTPLEQDAAEAGKMAGQFRKNDSPSGLQLGLSDEDITGEIPEELRDFAQQGALASADRNWKKAREAYGKMVDAAPDNALALANLGLVEYRLGDYENAVEHLRASLSRAPEVAHHWLALGLCYYEARNYDLALSCLFRAKHEDRSDPRVRLYLAVVARANGWTMAAEKELQQAVAIDPQYTDAHFNLALIYLERDPPAAELARRHYYYALDLGADPDKEIENRLREAAGAAAR